MGEQLGFAFTRHRAIGEVGSLERFLIIFHALRLLWVMLVDVMTYSHLFFFSSFMLFRSALPVSMVQLLRGRLHIVSCTLNTESLIFLIDRVYRWFYIFLEYTF